MKSMLKDAAILFAITLCAGLILGFVFNITKEPIAIAEEKAAQEAYKEVFPDAAAFAKIELAVPEDAEYGASWTAAGYESVEIGQVLWAKDTSGTVLGYVITPKHQAPWRKRSPAERRSYPGCRCQN